MTMTDSERTAKLAKLGLAVDGESLAQSPAKAAAPAGVDPHTMPVSEIVFDPAMLDGFDLSTGAGFKAASDAVFARYRSPHKDKDRHSLLHRRITEFVGKVRTSRETGGHVKETVKADRDTRELAKLLASKGLTAADLIQLLG